MKKYIGFFCLIILIIGVLIFDGFKYVSTDITVEHFDKAGVSKLTFTVDELDFDSLSISEIQFVSGCVTGTMEVDASAVYSVDKIDVIHRRYDRNNSQVTTVMGWRSLIHDSCESPQFVEIPVVFYTKDGLKEKIFRTHYSNVKHAYL